MKLDDIIKRIDTLDIEVLALIQERMGLVLRSQKFKHCPSPAEREAAAYDRARRLDINLVEPDFAEQLLRTIIKESTRLQEQNRKIVAFQGEHGAHSEVAARRLIPKGAYVPCSEFRDVFNGVENGFFDLGVVPVENSLEGAVTQVNNLLTTTDLKVIGEAKQPIRHFLLADQETDLRDIRMVYSHPQALAQCRRFLLDNDIESRPFYDTAGAARMVSRERPKASAAIASSLSAQLYGLKIIKKGIEDAASNSTRFLLLSKENDGVKNGNKCSVIFATTHEAGSLHGVLNLFAAANINLTRIASMPLRTDPNHYSFFLDFEGSDKDERIAKTLAEMGRQTGSFKFLGCYPADSEAQSR